MSVNTVKFILTRPAVQVSWEKSLLRFYFIRGKQKGGKKGQKVRNTEHCHVSDGWGPIFYSCRMIRFLRKVAAGAKNFNRIVDISSKTFLIAPGRLRSLYKNI